MLEIARRNTNLREMDIASHLHAQTNLKAHETTGPLIVAGGEGCYFYDDSGKRYLDMHAGLWSLSLGLGNERLAEAAARQFKTLAYAQTFGHRSSEPVIELCDALVSLAPVPMSKAMLQSSGSEANETAVKIAWYYWNSRNEPGRRKIIARKRAYHGTTAVAASLTDLPHMHAGFGLPLPGFLHVSCPDTYRGPNEGESEAEFATRLAEELDATIRREGPETIAAFIAEPVMGAGGIYTPPDTYFPKIREVLNRYGILLIADEVICGFGRTGAWWGSQSYGVEPDMITSAKALSSSYLPISALMINQKIYETIAEKSDSVGVFGHGYTYGGHPVCAAVALETIRIYQEDALIDRAAGLDAVMRRHLEPLKDHPLVGDVRGRGLMWGVEVVADKKTKKAFEPAQKVGARVSNACFQKGLNTRAVGGHVLAFTPALIVTEEEISTAAGLLTEALDQVEAELRQEN
ncbi:MAG: aminotransferase [Mesorhizobium sp.]